MTYCNDALVEEINIAIEQNNNQALELGEIVEGLA